MELFGFAAGEFFKCISNALKLLANSSNSIHVHVKEITVIKV